MDRDEDPEERDRRRRRAAAANKWRRNNREKCRLYSMRYKNKNREQCNLRDRRARRRWPPERILYHLARDRTYGTGIPFNITVADINVPKRCPILGIRLRRSKRRCSPNSPSLDRINPRRGYVRGNIMVISHRANTLKSNATVKEIKALYDFMRRLS